MDSVNKTEETLINTFSLGPSLDGDFDIDVAEGTFYMEASLPDTCIGRDGQDSKDDSSRVEKNKANIRHLEKVINSSSSNDIIPDHTPNKQLRQELSYITNSGDASSVTNFTCYGPGYVNISGVTAGSSTFQNSDLNYYPSQYGHPSSSLPNNHYQWSSECTTPSLPNPSTTQHRGNTSHTSRDNDNRNGIAFVDASLDQGYSSHSTESSCQGQDSQIEGSAMEQGSQVTSNPVSSGSNIVNWQNKECYDETYLHGENELEDLLYHFKNFFANRFESEIHQFKESFYSIIEEQQSHVRQIVHTAMREHSSQNSGDDILFEAGAIMSNEEAGAIMTSEPNKTDSVDVSTGGIDISELRFPLSPLKTANRLPSNPDGTNEKTQTLLELMSQACTVSTLLAKPQFRT